MSVVTPEHPLFGVWDNQKDGGWIRAPAGRNLATRLGPVQFDVQEILSGEGASLRISEYKFTLTGAASGREVFAYHLHTGQFPKPHFHLGAAAGVLVETRYKAHFPTGGAVALGELIRLIVRDLGARPLLPNWEQILDEPLEG